MQNCAKKLHQVVFPAIHVFGENCVSWTGRILPKCHLLYGGGEFSAERVSRPLRQRNAFFRVLTRLRNAYDGIKGKLSLVIYGMLVSTSDAESLCPSCVVPFYSGS
jgi:hypothetical protein